MASQARKPLVLVNGEIAQMPAGDTLAASVTEVDVIQLVNEESTLAFAVGEVAYISSSGKVKKANAVAPATSDALGLAAAAIAAGGLASGPIQTDGVLTGMTGLTPGATYYLSDTTPGLITTTAPSASGSSVTRIGKAVSATILEISIKRPILL